MRTRCTLARFILYTVFSIGIINTACARDQIRIVGSTSVYLFSTAVAEYFGKTAGFKTPVVEATGTGAGINIFCAGVGLSYPDIVNTSRPMTQAEYRQCAQNGIHELIEVKIGRDGIVIGAQVQTAPFNLSLKDLYQALAREVIAPNGKEIMNPYHTWNQINPALPHRKILVLGPSPNLGTRETFENLVIKKGCMQQTKDASKCNPILREDGAFKDVGEHENIILQKIEINREALGIFSFGFLEQNHNKIRALPIEGILPSFESITSGDYPISRPLFFYVKKAHISLIPGIMEFVKAFLSPQAIGSYGYLTNKGLAPLTKEESCGQILRIFHNQF